MRLRIILALLVLGIQPPPAAAQEAVPPMQPPLPTAPPPMKWPMAVRPFGFDYHARLQTDDAVAALAVRGFFRIAAPDDLTEPALDCLRRDREDHACIQPAVTGVTFEHHDPLPLVFVDGRLEDGVLSWTCVGRARIVAVDFALADFFTPDLPARQMARNRALACIERALGFDRDREHADL